MSELTLEAIAKVKEEIEKLGPRPFFHYCRHITTVIYGPLVDELLANIYPDFNPKLHKGYIVPQEYQDLIEKECR